MSATASVPRGFKHATSSRVTSLTEAKWWYAIEH